MSNQGFLPNRGQRVPSVPRGDELGSFDNYEQARALVTTLVEADFPPKSIAIVGQEINSVERVTAKLTAGRAALSGALTGAWLGLFFGMLLVLVQPTTVSFAYLGAAVLIGAGLVTIFRVASFSAASSRRNYVSQTQFAASRYVVVVDAQLSNRAKNILSGNSVVPPAGQPQTAHSTEDRTNQP